MKILMSYRTQQFTLEITERLIKHKEDIIYLLVENEITKRLITRMIIRTKLDINKIKIITTKELLKDKKMKDFDYIVGNPPYQESVGDNGKTQQIWSALVVKFYDMLKDNGEMSLIHPGGWRFLAEKSKKNLMEIYKIYTTNKITKMQLNDKIKGQETFGASTDYDVVTLIKKPYNGLTKVEIQMTSSNINLKEFKVIPTNNIELFKKLKVGINEDKVQLLYTPNAYEVRKQGTKPWMQETKSKLFKYPVVYTITEKSGVKLWYSNTKDNGHFGISKLILKKGATSTLLDLDGKYGMSQFASAIIDKPENLIRIKKVLETKKFTAVQVNFTGSNDKNSIIDGTGTMFKFIKEFRKDFWKEFYTSEMEQELIQEGLINSKGEYIGQK